MPSTFDSLVVSQLIGTLLPGSILLISLLGDTLSSLSLSGSLKSFLHHIWSPFSNFLSLDDLHDPLGPYTSRSLSHIRFLAGIAFLQFAVSISSLVYSFALQDNRATLHVLLACISWMYIAFQICHLPVTVPLSSFFLAVSYVLYYAVKVFYHLIRSDSLVVLDLLSSILPLSFVAISGTLPLQHRLSCPNVAGPSSVPSVSLSCPEDNVTLWQWCSFSFVKPLFKITAERTLNDVDVWTLSPYFRHRNLFLKLLEYRANNPSHSLLWFLIASNSLDLILDLVLELWGAIIGFVCPYALQQILLNLPSDDQSEDDPKVKEGRKTAFYWAFLILACHLSFAQVDLFQAWHTRRCYERTRGQLFCMIHYKALRRTDIASKPPSPNQDENEKDSSELGRIVNLMQGDAYSVAQRFWEFSGLFVSPIRIIIALSFLYTIIGWSAFAAVGIFIIASILNYPLATYNVYITKESWKARDKRMNMVNELLQNIRFLKYYGWEGHWARTTQTLRDQELAWRVKENVVATLITFIWSWVPSVTALLSFLCYTLVAGERLTVATAFTAIALFSSLQGPLTSLPGQIFAILHAYVSMQRIEKFLGEDEVPSWASTLKKASTPDASGLKFGFENGALFKWPASLESPFELGPLDFHFPQGCLTLVTGATGSGKTALLSALLGEMSCHKGSVSIDKTGHKVAYCAQNTWLEHATIRDNIVFSSTAGFDEARYNQVLEACCLLPDLNILIDGDMTEIGEKGITLSGGQRARVALARALYSPAQLILLDDPLAAVDMHTAQHLVEKAFQGPLAEDRTIVLVTHHISPCLPVAKYLVELSKGKVLHSGTITSLQERGILDDVIEAEDEAFAEDEAVEVPVSSDNEADLLEKEVSESCPPRKGTTVLIEEEFRAEGKVSWKTYMAYARAAGYAAWTLTCVLLVLQRFIGIADQVFLASWGEAYESSLSSIVRGFTSLGRKSMSAPWEKFPSPIINPTPWLLVYSSISLAGALCFMSSIALGYYSSLQASRKLFQALLQRLTRAPSRFFDTTPVGRILNRFVSDINTIDNALQSSARQCLVGILIFLASFLVMLVVIPVFAPFALFIAWLYIRLAPPYVQTSRDLRRLESVSLSPAFAGFDEMLRGIVHVRAFGAEDRYQNQFYRKVDKFQSFDHMYWLVSSWLRWHYDCLGSLIVFVSTAFAIGASIPNGSTAIVIVQAGIFAEASRQLVKVAAQLELDFNSVERVVEYLNVPQEAPATIEPESNPLLTRLGWPASNASIIFENFEVQYSVDLPPVLKKINFEIKPHEKLGVCGRTGSGKSTLAMSLLRMIESSGGKIIIDGIDISTVGLEDLRKRITIVSQDVALFTGTLRSNLDPLGEHSTEDCLKVVEKCHLRRLLSLDLDDSVLDTPIGSGSLSAGERQMVAIARAILRSSERQGIIIMDEATSQIDSQLDDQIQATLREHLSDSIIITIAHRLKTIIDYDRILVLSDGQIAELDTPQALLQKPGGVFREMCKKSADWKILRRALNGEGSSVP